MQTTLYRPRTAVFAIAIATLALSGCDRNDDRTVGQRVDATIQTAENKARDLKNDAEDKARELKTDAKQSSDRAGDSLSTTLKDAEITTAVNAALARDRNLSALAINVDTNDGRVALRGTAPDVVARDRATTLATAVKGVVSVDNQLSVSPKS